MFFMFREFGRVWVILVYFEFPIIKDGLINAPAICVMAHFISTTWQNNHHCLTPPNFYYYACTVYNIITILQTFNSFTLAYFTYSPPEMLMYYIISTGIGLWSLLVRYITRSWPNNKCNQVSTLDKYLYTLRS